MHKSYHLFFVMALSLISIKIPTLSYSLLAFNCSLGDINIATPGKLFYHRSPHVFFISLLLTFCKQHVGFPGGSVVKKKKKSPANAGDAGSIPGLGRSPKGGNGNLLQYYCLRNPMNRGPWQDRVHRISELDMTEQLNNKAECIYFLKKFFGTT